MTRISIAIVDDSDIFRKTLKGFLENKGYEVVGEAADADSGLDLVRTTKPDVVLLDLSMPRRSGDVIVPDIRSESPKTKILILSIYDQTSGSIQADGYCAKESTREDILRAIETALQSKN